MFFPHLVILVCILLYDCCWPLQRQICHRKHTSYIFRSTIAHEDGKVAEMILCQMPHLFRSDSKVFSGLRNRDQELLLDRDYLLPPSHRRCEFFIFHCLILLQNSTPQGSSYIPVQRPESQLLLQEYRSSDLQKISGENHLHLSINQISPGTQILMDWAQGCSSTLFFLSLGIRSQTVVWILKKGHALPQNSPIMRYNYAHGDNVMTWCRGIQIIS